MWPTRSRTSQPALRVITFQLLVSETSLVNLSRSRRMTLKIVDLASPANGLTGLITAVLIRIPSQRSDRPRTLMGPGRRRGRHDDRGQDLVEAILPHLEPGWQAQCGSQLLGRFIDGETGAVGRDLVEHAARLAEVDRLEVPAVDHWRHVATRSCEQLAPRHLRMGVRCSPRDVVHRADGLLPLRSLRRLDHVDDGVRPAGTRLEARAVAFLRRLSEAHRVREQVDRARRLGDGQGHRVEPAYGVLLVDRRLLPRLPVRVAGLADELELDPVRVGEDDRVGVEPGHPAMVYTQLLHPVAPEIERPRRDLERDGRHLAASGSLLRPGRPAEECHHGPRRADVVGEIDVIGIGQVLVDALLDEAKAEHANVEIDALLHVARDARHVVGCGDAGGHWSGASANYSAPPHVSMSLNLFPPRTPPPSARRSRPPEARPSPPVDGRRVT